jgi:hypothetical protein
MALPFDIENPDSALASIKMANSLFFMQNNDLMDLVVVAEHEGESKKNHELIVQESLKISPEEE